MTRLVLIFAVIIAAFEILPYCIAIAAVLGITAALLLRKGRDADAQ